jgi:hypothetical protein
MAEIDRRFWDAVEIERRIFAVFAEDSDHLLSARGLSAGKSGSAPVSEALGCKRTNIAV